MRSKPEWICLPVDVDQSVMDVPGRDLPEMDEPVKGVPGMVVPILDVPDVGIPDKNMPGRNVPLRLNVCDGSKQSFLRFEREADKWIWHDNDQVFRKEFYLDDPGRILGAVLLISVDEGYRLLINGREACRSDGKIFSWCRPACIDVREFLRKGLNYVEIEAFNTYLEKPGACLRLRIRFDERPEVNIRTDESWVTSKGDTVRVVARMGEMPWRIPESRVTPLPVVHFIKKFTVERQIEEPFLEISALGIVEARINGRRPAGHPELLPGWTDYRFVVPLHKLMLETLPPGEHTLELLLSAGWYAGYLGWERHRRYYGDQPAVYAELKDGDRQVIATDATWDAGIGPWQEADLLMGEVVDARQPAEFNSKAILFSGDTPEFQDVFWEPVRIVETLLPADMRIISPGRMIVDFGRIITGFTEIEVSGRRGSSVKIMHSEVLNSDGTLYLEHNRMARAEDVYVLKGSGLISNSNSGSLSGSGSGSGLNKDKDTGMESVAVPDLNLGLMPVSESENYRPFFSCHGFRYAEFDTETSEVMFRSVRAHRIKSDVQRTGFFSSDILLINSIYNSYIGSAECTLVDIPADCNQRDERLGWTGDGCILAESHMGTFDLSSFYRKWLADLFRAQKEDGSLPDIAPWVEFGSGIAGWNNPAWPDAAVWVTSQLIRFYGLTDFAESALPNLMRYTERIWADSENGYRHGGSYGDWLNVDSPTPKDLIGTAFHAMLCREMQFICSETGHAALSEKYGQRLQQITSLYQDRFLNTKRQILELSQTACVLTLKFGLAVSSDPQEIRKRLVADILNRGKALSTGFLGTPWLLDELSEAGRSDLAVDLLKREEFPSWGFMIRHGATALWEHWDSYHPEKGFKDPVMNSFSHASLGSFAFWFYKRAGWINNVDLKNRIITIRPDVAPYLKRVQVSRLTPLGKIDVHWEVTGPEVKATVTVPQDCSIILESETTTRLDGGTHQITLPISHLIQRYGNN